MSSEIPANEERTTALERIDRPAPSRLRLVSDPRNRAVETNDGKVGDFEDGPLHPTVGRGEAARLSPTQALLGLEREGWARVNNGAVQRVEVNERSVQAALHKENIEKFQATLLQSGEWVRSNDLEIAVEAPASPQLEPPATVSATDGHTSAQQVQMAAARVEVQSPSKVDAPAVTSKASDESVSQKSSNANELAINSQAGQTDPRLSVLAPAAEPKSQQVPGWDEIDEKLLWLATPSS